ncbi:NADPH:quinone reductase-like Zn-dependent oxidoreductase [Agromyces flavus]|uniref:NADPH:quinone reductase n=1 Tax=Agromyces flavus TaxID=589382 RepID=A0A1H1WDZ7_9MICO|nr:NAD(P)-dependent alcohol dehydrogenase [Agromyces flavus]MCP2366144.1 NADPH:quinone reductase-like Zn-dependent oxidoreductase [Agromyces flavus]GGI44088.1 alcohol dehydrogenase [Agromyces flavus]SDS94891.1 NADPH:quinone reductase [Agromyces flavus]
MTTAHRENATSAPLVSTMRAAVADRFGGPDVVRVGDVPRPQPRPDELLVRVHASTVSIADHRLRSREVPRGLALVVGPTIGFFRPRVRVLGMEAAGLVEAVGDDVTRFAPGDEVILMRGSRFGGHAEYVTIAETGEVAHKPANLSFDEAAAVIFGGHTAIRYLDQVEIGPGTEVLVNGASGAVGSAVVQLAAQRGATVTAVTSARNAELVRSLGAARVVDYTREDFAASGSDIRYDVVVDCVGNAPFERVAPVIRPGGTLLLVITDLRGMLAAGGQTRRSGIRVDHRGGDFGADGMARLAALAESGALRPVIDRTYPLDEVVEAHRYVDIGRKRGSVVVRIV